jgi:hypothetical protein
MFFQVPTAYHYGFLPLQAQLFCRLSGGKVEKPLPSRAPARGDETNIVKFMCSPDLVIKQFVECTAGDCK